MPCLTPDCQSEKLYSRGLCRKCYERIAKKVCRGTLKWQDLIEQGLAKRASRAGPSYEVRSTAQKGRKARGNPYGLSDVMWQAAIKSAKEKLTKPEELTESERLHYNGILSLAGET